MKNEPPVWRCMVCDRRYPDSYRKRSCECGGKLARAQDGLFHADMVGKHKRAGGHYRG